MIVGLCSPLRLRILRLLRTEGPLNVNEIANRMALPQSTIATNVGILGEAELIRTETSKARKGQQKVCAARYDEIIIRLDHAAEQQDNIIEVAMPVGLYTGCQVSAPCGMCSTERVIGLLDVPDGFLDPNRMQAALIWFGRGHVEYKFPNNARISGRKVRALELSLELSSEVPGTNTDWPSDISIWINDIRIGTWTSPGDYGDKRGLHTPRWWKLAGSQYGQLTRWWVTGEGCFVGEQRVSAVTLADLALDGHSSIRLRIGIEEAAEHPGGINIFGRGFGNHDQDILLRLHL